MIEKYNKQIYNSLIKDHPYLQLGFFKGDILFIGQNPGMPFNQKTIQDTEKMKIGEINYEDLIKNSNIGIFLSKIINFDSISFTNIVKVPTINNELPSQQLIDIFWPITQKQIEIFKPKIIVCLGKFAGNFFNLTEFYKKKKENEINYVMFPHPSFLSKIPNIEEHLTMMKLKLGKYKIINAWDFDRNEINLLIRENGAKIIKTIKSFKFYFYIKTKDIEKLDLIQDKIKVKENQEFSKIYCNQEIEDHIKRFKEPTTH